VSFMVEEHPAVAYAPPRRTARAPARRDRRTAAGSSAGSARGDPASRAGSRAGADGRSGRRGGRLVENQHLGARRARHDGSAGIPANRAAATSWTGMADVGGSVRRRAQAAKRAGLIFMPPAPHGKVRTLACRRRSCGSRGADRAETPAALRGAPCATCRPVVGEEAVAIFSPDRPRPARAVHGDRGLCAPRHSRFADPRSTSAECSKSISKCSSSCAVAPAILKGTESGDGARPFVRGRKSGTG
jgi:hypothetical protein